MAQYLKNEVVNFIKTKEAMKKQMLIFIVTPLLFVACSKEEIEEAKPIAVNDFYTAKEGSRIEINVLSNDVNILGAKYYTDLVSRKEGNITQDAEGNYFYKPAKNFVGEDTFNYFLYNKSFKNFSQGTVKVRVDKASLKTVDDEYVVKTNKKTKLSFSGFLENDDIEEVIVSTGISSKDTKGEVFFIGDAVWYTPPTNFTGIDTFTYILCDDDKKQECSTATVTIKVIN